MLIQDAHKPQRRRALLRLMLLTGGLLLFLLYIALRPAPSPYRDLPEGQIYCGAEKVSGGQFRGNGAYFSGGETQSTACARYGSYGSRLSGGDTLQIGIGYRLERARPGQAYRASIWYRSQKDSAAHLAAVVEGNPRRRWDTSEPATTDSLGWSLLELYFYVPYSDDTTHLRVYAYSTGKAPVCFDDMLIAAVAEPANFQLPRLHIEPAISGSASAPGRIAAILRSDSSGRLPVTLFKVPAGGTVMRIQMKKASWQSLSHFTLRPLQRADEAEAWLFHQLCSQAGLLTARYGFTEVYHHRRALGLYAFEEALDSHFIHRIPYPDGPIVQISDFGESLYPLVQAVYPLADSLLGRQAQIAQARRLLTQYKTGEVPLSQLVEIEELAAYFATATLLGKAPPSRQRWYYNPTTNKLHPIAWGSLETNRQKNPPLLRRLMQNEVFLSSYLSALYHKTEADSARALLEPLAASWGSRANHAQRALSDSLPGISELLRQIQRQRQRLIPRSRYTITAYTQSLRGPNRQLLVLNQHSLPLQVVGYGRDSTRLRAGLEKPRLLWPAAWQNADRDSAFTAIEVGAAATHLFYKLPGVDQLFSAPILPSSAPLAATDYQLLMEKGRLEKDAPYTVSGQQVVFPSGTHTLRKTLVVPEGYTLVLEAGANILLDQQASILSRGPVKAIGLEERPVKIEATYSGGGVAVLQASGKSDFQYVLMQNLKPPAFRDWRLTAGFTLYESAATVRHCAWLKGRGGAAVQTIRSKVQAQECLVDQAEQDGWQLDYSRGDLRSCRFEQCGRDGLALTGSQVELREGRLRGNARLGVLATANARLKGRRAIINGSQVGVVASDGARMDWTGLRLEDCPTGFAAFQKKPEFAPAQITITGLEVDAVEQLQDASSPNRIIID